MDSPHTTPMLTSRDIRVLHLESSDVCQARCPQCARETDKDFDPRQQHNLTVESIENILPDGFVEKLDKMFMCGNYGDPAANHQTLAIYRWFRKKNPSIVLGMNTNGGLQNTFWWHELAKIMDQPQDYVVFSIDGLEDTNSDYRVGVNWHKLMQNAEAFIANGGSAHWDMLVYRHNEHQVDQCEQLARAMGFKWFRAKVSNRGFTDKLEAPVGWQLPSATTSIIKCHAQQEKSMYIDARGRVSACCWLGSTQTNFVKDDLKTVKLTWHTDSPNPICVAACSTNKKHTVFQEQWQREVQL